jgi:hypothetical protein
MDDDVWRELFRVCPQAKIVQGLVSEGCAYLIIDTTVEARAYNSATIATSVGPDNEIDWCDWARSDAAGTKADEYTDMVGQPSEGQAHIFWRLMVEANAERARNGLSQAPVGQEPPFDQ